MPFVWFDSGKCDVAADGTLIRDWRVIGKQAGRQASKQAGRQTDRQASRLYYFTGKGRQTVANAKKLQKLAREGRSWTPLKKKLGKPEKKQSFDSCNDGGGKNILYRYKHVDVTTYKPASGGKQVIEDVSAR